MSIGHSQSDLALRLPLDRIAEVCRRYAVARLWVFGPILEHDPAADEDVEFLVEFVNNDAGSWGSKLDLLENDLSGVMHHKADVASRNGVGHSTPSPWRERVLDSARPIYGS